MLIGSTGRAQHPTEAMTNHARRYAHALALDEQIKRLTEEIQDRQGQLKEAQRVLRQLRHTGGGK